MSQLIGLLTDFGLQDVYVAVMKGVIAQINPQVQVIDITHQISPQDILAAGWNLSNACPYFPQDTIYVAVVDPGVGSNRRAIAVQFEMGYLIGPDNGLFSHVLSLYPPLTAVELTNPQYWRITQPSLTFHGRDIFAPVAAHLAQGIPLVELGSKIGLDSLLRLPITSAKSTHHGYEGLIQYIDGFGNIISNIPGKSLKEKSWSVKVNGITIKKQQTYSNVPQGELLSLIGSHGWVEIAVNGGSAQRKLQLNLGNLIILEFDS